MKKIFLILIFYFSILISNNSFAQSISGGSYHVLTACSDSTVRTWGSNNFGQLGNGTNTDSNVPVQVSILTGITAIAGGNSYSLALKGDGTVWVWGANSTVSNVPVQVSALSGITTIAGGFSHSLALKNNGTVS